ncbi:MAG: VPS10 domain-containing protein, partial [Lysobacteraceae bacterium]
MKTHSLVAAIVLAAGGTARAADAPAVRFDSATISGLGARNIGSATMSGRISAIAAHTDAGKVTIYAGAASGGIWKSEDSGTTYEPIFDKQPVQSIGALALDPNDPETLWVGTGESWTRNSVSIGNGVYRTRDGGSTWEYLGLPNSERITKILVHPKDGNTVYVCAPGKLWSDSPDRGLYRTRDGGASWQLVLKGPNLSTGCSGVTMDPSNPDVMFAGTWDFRRQGWTFRSGGEGPTANSGSGLFRSTDGGSTWRELAAGSNGLPAKPYGRIEVEIAPSDPKRVYAFIEGVDSALYASEEGGATWEKRDKSQMMVWRPFYFANLIVDPTNADRVFKTNLRLIVSTDGGKSFADTAGATHADSHDVWVNPTNPQHIVMGDDGGMWYSYDGGSRWWKADNLPISQFYRVAVDQQDPYQVYGGLQDNSSWIGDSSYPGGVTNDRWNNIYGGDGFWVLPDNADPRYVYAEYQGGNIT